MTISISNGQVSGNIDTSGAFNVIMPLGVEKSGGYVIDYKSFLMSGIVNDYADLTPLETAIKVINDKAPVIKTSSNQNTYIVGKTTEPVIAFTVTDSDVGDKAIISTSVNASNGTLIFKENGDVLYNPNVGFFGVDRFTVHAVDSFGAYRDQEVSINVVNGLPIASSIKADVTSGVAPYSSKLNLISNNPDDATRISRIEWQQRAAGTAEWIP